MATIRANLPYKLEEINNVFIPLKDGTRLTARLWLPQTSEPVPAILEYLPYRKNDDMAVRDSLNHRYIAGHGYAAVRVDMRGSGDSDGMLMDEYLEQEICDGLEVLEWLEGQPWCSGNVGMFGISWGGFNSLQIAARRPKQLKAIMPIGFSDDRYATTFIIKVVLYLLATCSRGLQSCSRFKHCRQTQITALTGVKNG